MSLFIVLALLMAAVAVAVVAVPLLDSRSQTPRAYWAALGAGAVIAVGAATLYVSLTNWSWPTPDAPATPQVMVGQLARRLRSDPNDLAGWLMLGRSYAALAQYPLAARAYEHADRLAGGRNAQALMGLGEALVQEDAAQLEGRAGRLFEQALALDPKSGKALFYGAAAALRRGDLPLARQRFTGLLALNPPGNVRPILQAQIEAIDRKLSGKASSP